MSNTFLIIAAISIIVCIYYLYTHRPKWLQKWIGKGKGRGRKNRPRMRKARVVEVRARNPLVNIALEQFANILDYEVRQLNDNVPQDEIREEVRPIYIDILDGLMNNEIGRDEWEVWEGVTDFIQHADWIEWPGMGQNFAEQAAAASSEELMQRARETTNAPAEAAEKYFETSVRHTVDTQNVHESKIVKGAADIYNKIARDQVSPLPMLTDIEQYLGTISDDKKRTAALQTFDFIRNNKQNLSAIGADESTILRQVWARASHPDNAAHKSDMQEAVANALADGYEGGNVVCASGRATRLLYAFTDLDKDQEIAHSTPMSYEAYKNQIFTETSGMLRVLIDEAKVSSDPLVRQVGEAYEGRGEAPPEQEEAFKEKFKDQVRANLDNYREKLTDTERNMLMTECCAVID